MDTGVELESLAASVMGEYWVDEASKNFVVADPWGSHMILSAPQVSEHAMVALAGVAPERVIWRLAWGHSPGFVWRICTDPTMTGYGQVVDWVETVLGAVAVSGVRPNVEVEILKVQGNGTKITLLAGGRINKPLFVMLFTTQVLRSEDGRKTKIKLPDVEGGARGPLNPALDRLTPQQRTFVLAYVGETNGNGASTARKAKYAAPRQADVKLRNMQLVQEAIKECYAGAAMTVEEVHARLADMARATIDDALETVPIYKTDDDGNPTVYNAETEEPMPEHYITRVCLEKLRESGMIHQVASISYNQFGPIVKLVDKQGALDKIARARGMYQGEGSGVQVVIKDLRGVDVDAV